MGKRSLPTCEYLEFSVFLHPSFGSYLKPCCKKWRWIIRKRGNRESEKTGLNQGVISGNTTITLPFCRKSNGFLFIDPLGVFGRLNMRNMGKEEFEDTKNVTFKNYLRRKGKCRYKCLIKDCDRWLRTSFYKGTQLYKQNYRTIAVSILPSNLIKTEGGFHLCLWEWTKLAHLGH